MKLLFIAPAFYGYEVDIINELKKRYDEVRYLNELPLGTTVFTNLLHLLPKQISKTIYRIYNDKIKKLVLTNKFDVIFIIKGAILSEDLLVTMRNMPNKPFIVNYQWDSISNNPNANLISKYADKNYTFDFKDAQVENYTYIPLFYTWDNPDSSILKFKKKYIFFLGGFHRMRYELIQNFISMCQKLLIPFKFFIYINRFVYFRHKYFLKEDIEKKDIIFNKMSRKQYIQHLKKSIAVLDIQNPNQTGLTIRTIEALSMGCKIITTNRNICSTNLYTPNNILVWDGHSDLELSTFLSSPFDTNVWDNIYSVKTWIDKLGI